MVLTNIIQNHYNIDSYRYTCQKAHEAMPLEAQKKACRRHGRRTGDLTGLLMDVNGGMSATSPMAWNPPEKDWAVSSSPGSCVGNIGFEPIMRALADVNHDGWITLECVPLPTEYGCAKRGADYLKALETVIRLERLNYREVYYYGKQVSEMAVL